MPLRPMSASPRATDWSIEAYATKRTAACARGARNQLGDLDVEATTRDGSAGSASTRRAALGVGRPAQLTGLCAEALPRRERRRKTSGRIAAGLRPRAAAGTAENLFHSGYDANSIPSRAGRTRPRLMAIAQRGSQLVNNGATDGSRNCMLKRPPQGSINRARHRGPGHRPRRGRARLFRRTTTCADLFLGNMPVLIVALGVTLVILTGNIDISVGSMFAICGVAAGVLAKAGAPMIARRAVAACLAGAALGGAQRRAGRLRPHPVDRRHAGDDGGAARRAALGDPGRVGAGPARRLPVVRPAPGRVPVRRRAPSSSCCKSGSAWGMRNLAAGRAVYATGSNEHAARLAGLRHRAR